MRAYLLALLLFVTTVVAGVAFVWSQAAPVLAVVR